MLKNKQGAKQKSDDVFWKCFECETDQLIPKLQNKNYLKYTYMT